MKQIYTIILILSLTINVIYSVLDDCTYNNSILGLTYNLGLLNNVFGYDRPLNIPGQTQALVKFNFCINEGLSNCTDSYSNACIDYNNSTQVQLGGIGNQYTIDNPDGGLYLVYYTDVQPTINNNCSLNNNKREIKFNLICFLGIPYMAGDVTQISNCQYELTILTEYVCASCINPNCSNHGACNQNKGICECDSQTSGENCTESIIYVSSSDPTYENGGYSSVYGYFGQVTNKFQIYIGDLLCSNYSQISSYQIKCNVPPGHGFKNITVYDNNGVYFSGKNLFKYMVFNSSCPDNCFNEKDNGDCVNGYCVCKNGFNGYNCELKDYNQPNITINSTTGGISINNEFLINIYSLVEIDIDGSIVNDFILTKNWTESSNNNSDIENIIFKQPLNSSNLIKGTIEYQVEFIKKEKNYNFAGYNFTLNKDSIKTSITISGYKFSNSLNTLQLRLLSSLDEKNNNQDCNSNSTSINASFDENFNYLKIIKDNKVFSGRFLSRILSDSHISFIHTEILKQDNSSIFFSLNLPHCITQCLIDPDFSLLIKSDFKESCGDSKKEKWFLPVVIAVPIIGFSIIIVISTLVYKKNRIPIKIYFKSFKIKKSKNIQLE